MTILRTVGKKIPRGEIFTIFAIGSNLRNFVCTKFTLRADLLIDVIFSHRTLN